MKIVEQVDGHTTIEFEEDDQEIQINHGKHSVYIEPFYDYKGDPCHISVAR